MTLVLAFVVSALLPTYGLAKGTAVGGSARVAASGTGVAVTVHRDGRYEVDATSKGSVFRGEVGHPLTSVAAGVGSDTQGRYREITFHYQASAARTGGIRVYDRFPIVVFDTAYPEGGRNVEPFPQLSAYPKLPYRLVYTDDNNFGHYAFKPSGGGDPWLDSDSPWLFFDARANGFLLSSADHFMVARTFIGTGGSIASGIEPAIPFFPRGWRQRTLLVLGYGVNEIYSTWGTALTELKGKRRPDNEADITLQKLAYWTDNGATYYYRYGSSRLESSA